MKPINETEFDTSTASAAAHGAVRQDKLHVFRATLHQFLRSHEPLDLLTARQQRDAELDEAAIERRKLATAPLIR